MSDAMTDMMMEADRQMLYPYRVRCVNCNTLLMSDIENDKDAMCVRCNQQIHRELHSLGC